mmetsp:Transcript_20367/g.54278  ORF Transcript_20367/g.54278 Transcript_20367/m.54278 type:complete len:217 (+) Transcript_20367:234-884(+)
MLNHHVMKNHTSLDRLNHVVEAQFLNVARNKSEFLLQNSKSSFNVFPCAFLPLLERSAFVVPAFSNGLDEPGKLRVNSIHQHPDLIELFAAHFKSKIVLVKGPINQSATQWGMIKDCNVIVVPWGACPGMVDPQIVIRHCLNENRWLFSFSAKLSLPSIWALLPAKMRAVQGPSHTFYSVSFFVHFHNLPHHVNRRERAVLRKLWSGIKNLGSCVH